MTINFHPEDLNISLYSGDHSLLNFRVYSTDSENYTTTGSWGFLFYNKEKGGIVCSTKTQAENGDIIPGASPLTNLSVNPLFNTAGVVEVYISGSVSNILSSSANNIGYELYLNTASGRVTFIKGNSTIESRITG